MDARKSQAVEGGQLVEVSQLSFLNEPVRIVDSTRTSAKDLRRDKNRTRKNPSKKLSAAQVNLEDYIATTGKTVKSKKTGHLPTETHVFDEEGNPLDPNKPKITKDDVATILTAWGVAKYAAKILALPEVEGRTATLNEWVSGEVSWAEQEVNRLGILESIVIYLEKLFYGFSEENLILAIRQWFRTPNIRLKNKTPLSFIENAENPVDLRSISMALFLEVDSRKIQSTTKEENLRQHTRELFWIAIKKWGITMTEMACILDLENAGELLEKLNLPQSVTSENESTIERMQLMGSVCFHIQRLKLKYGDKFDIVAWLREVNDHLEGQIPLELIKTEQGLKELREHLSRY